MNLDDLELELRKLRGVRAAGFTERDDVLIVQVQVTNGDVEPNLPVAATRIAYRHSEKPVALEIVRWRPAPAGAAPGGGPPPVTPAPVPPAPPPTPVGATGREPRVRLLAVLTFPDTDELEVHLTFAGRRVIGRGAARGGPLGVVEATIDGLAALVGPLPYRPAWARPLPVDGDRGALVAVGLGGDDDVSRYGLAGGASEIEAAARATLHALNRTLAAALAEASGGDPDR